MRTKVVSAVLGLLLATGVSAIYGQGRDPSPCDIQVQILTQGRAAVEAELAKAVIAIQEANKKVAALEAAAKTAEKK